MKIGNFFIYIEVPIRDNSGRDAVLNSHGINESQLRREINAYLLRAQKPSIMDLHEYLLNKFTEDKHKITVTYKDTPLDI